MSQSNGGLKGLFKGMQSGGVLSKGAAAVIDLKDIGQDIQDALGVSVDDIQASEVTLVTLLVDDSSSIRSASGNTQAVRDGHNGMLDVLVATKQRDSIIVMCRYLNNGILYPYAPVKNAPRMDQQNYNPQGGTPLFDESITTLAAVLAKAEEFDQNGIPCRTVTAILTDGGDSGSRKQARDVKQIVDGMLRRENHIIAGMGFDDGYTDFKQVFGEMGIRDEWILTSKNSPQEIRRAFAMLSQSAQRASQAAGTFSQAAMGGFGAP